MVGHCPGHHDVGQRRVRAYPRALTTNHLKDLQPDWLDPATADKNQVRELVSSVPEPHLAPRLIDKEVGSLGDNGPQLIEIAQ